MKLKEYILEWIINTENENPFSTISKNLEHNFNFQENKDTKLNDVQIIYKKSEYLNSHEIIVRFKLKSTSPKQAVIDAYKRLINKKTSTTATIFTVYQDEKKATIFNISNLENIKSLLTYCPVDDEIFNWN